MTHARQQIREAVVTALTGLAATGSRVHASRLRPTDALPALLVETADESVEQTVQTAQTRTLTVVVRGLAKAGTGVDAALDTIAEQVETAVQAAGTLGGKVPGGLTLTGITTEFDDALEQPVGVIALAFKTGYFTAAGNPGTLI